MIAMRNRDAGVVRRGKKGGDARNHLDMNPRVGHFLRFLTTTAKNIGIAPFETDDRLAFLRLGDEELVQVFLRDGVIARTLAGVNDLGGFWSQSKKVRIDQGVIKQHVCTRD